MAILFGISYPEGMLFTVPVSTLNIIIGLVTKKSPGLDLQPETANIRLMIDRGVVRGNIYQLVFLNSKLILKRLSSVMITAGLALVLAIIGLEFLFIIGTLMGGITGFSLQEYFTQRTRNKLSTGPRLDQAEKNDLEIKYDDLLEVKLARNRMYLISENSTRIVSLPRGYSAKLEPSLRAIFGTMFSTEESVRS